MEVLLSALIVPRTTVLFLLPPTLGAHGSDPAAIAGTTRPSATATTIKQMMPIITGLRVNFDIIIDLPLFRFNQFKSRYCRKSTLHVLSKNDFSFSLINALLP